MFFGKKKKFSEKVSRLVAMLGVPLSDMGILMPINSMIEQCRLQDFTEHETALILVYSCMPKLAAKDYSRAMALFYEVSEIADEWVKHQNVDQSNSDQWSNMAFEELMKFGERKP